MNNFFNLKKRVMARIYLEYTKDIISGYPDYFMLGIFIIVSFVSVSIYDVLINTTNIMKNDYSSVLSFLIAAIKNTSWIIQILIAGFFIRTTIAGTKIAYRNMSNKFSLIKFRSLKY